MSNEAAKQEAETKIRQALDTLADLLPKKARAYGDAHSLQLDLWRVFLRQYRDPHGMQYTIPEALLAHIPRMTRLLDRMLRIVANPAVDPHGEDPWMDAAGDCVAGMAMPKVPPPDAPYLHSGGAFARPGVPLHGPPDDDTAQGRASHGAVNRESTVAGPRVVHCTRPRCSHHGADAATVHLPCSRPDGCAGIRMPATAFGPSDDGQATKTAGIICGASFHTQVGARYCVKKIGHTGPHHDGMGLRSGHTYEELSGGGGVASDT